MPQTLDDFLNAKYGPVGAKLPVPGVSAPPLASPYQPVSTDPSMFEQAMTGLKQTVGKAAQWAETPFSWVKPVGEALTDPGSVGQATRRMAFGGTPVVGALLGDLAARHPEMGGFAAGTMESTVGTPLGAASLVASAVPGEGLLPSLVRTAPTIPGMIGGAYHAIRPGADVEERAKGVGEGALSGLLAYLGVRGRVGKGNGPGSPRTPPPAALPAEDAAQVAARKADYLAKVQARSAAPTVKEAGGGVSTPAAPPPAPSIVPSARRMSAPGTAPVESRGIMDWLDDLLSGKKTTSATGEPLTPPTGPPRVRTPGARVTGAAGPVEPVEQGLGALDIRRLGPGPEPPSAPPLPGQATRRNIPTSPQEWFDFLQKTRPASATQRTPGRLPSDRLPASPFETPDELPPPTPTQRTPGRLPSDRLPPSPFETPEDLPAPAPTQRTPGRLPSDQRPPSPFEPPEDTGEPITGSVGGGPTFGGGTPQQLPLGDAVIQQVRQALRARGIDPPADLPYGSPAREMYKQQLAHPDTASVVHETLREQVGDTIPVFRATKPGESGIVSVSLDPKEAEMYAQGGPVVEGHVPVESVVGPGEESHELRVDLTKVPQGALKPRIPRKVTALWQDLVPEWKKALAAQQGDEIPFQADPHEDLIPFARRVMSDDPSMLMSRERKVRRAVDTGESGFIDPTGAGELVKKIPAGIERLSYANMLAGSAQGANVLGGAGAVTKAALEDMLSGEARRGGRALMEYFNPKKWIRRAGEAYDTAPDVTGGDIPSRGPLSVPGRLMHAADQAGEEALKAAGYSQEEAHGILQHNQPRSKFGKLMVDLSQKGGRLSKILFPFAKVGTNLAEQGAEVLPGLGIPISKALTPGISGRRILARQILGTGAAAGAAAYSAKTGKPISRAAKVALGPLGMPAGIASAIAAGIATDKPGWTVGNDAMQAAFENTPLPTSPFQITRMFSPSSQLARIFVPAAARIPAQLASDYPALAPALGAAGRPAKDYQIPPVPFTDPRWMIDPAIAQVPWFRDLLLKAKAGRSARLAATTGRKATGKR